MTSKPKFTPDITLGSMISFVAIVFAAGGIWVAVQKDVEQVDLRSSSNFEEIRSLRSDVSQSRALAADVKRLADAVSDIAGRDRRQEIEIARQDERVTLILQAISELKAVIEADRRSIR